MNQSAYNKLCQEIWDHNKRYYVDHAPIISDREFDALMRRLQEIEKEHPDWICPTSPSQRVGEMLTEGFQTVKHLTPMLSLANTYSAKEIEDFIKRMWKFCGSKEVVFSCELKMDGVAVTARYENGIFLQGVTRGSGIKGDNITSNMKTIAGLPLQLSGERVPQILEARGEVYMPIVAFQSLNQMREKAGKALFANPRNAASGSLKQLDPRITAKRKLAIVFYSIAQISDKQLKSQFETHRTLKALGLPTLDLTAQCHTIEEIWDFTEKISNVRYTLPYHIDGVVVKLDDLKQQRKIGNTAKSPRWAVAYKFTAEKAKTKIKGITVQVGRSGVCTPVAELENILLAGSMISRATLHNEAEVQRKDIRVGDLATIQKGGDVIPKVLEVDPKARKPHTCPWTMPSRCPSCGEQLIKMAGEVAVRCPNTSHCPEQRFRRIVYFASKSAMDIEHLGERVLEQLIEKKFVESPSDIYRLSEEKLSQLEGFKAKAIQRLLQSIDRSKAVSLSRFILALGIKYVGAQTAELLANKAGNINALSAMSRSDLMSIDGVGEKVADSVRAFFSDPNNKYEIEKLIASGVHPEKVSVRNFENHPFSGKRFVLTGTLENYTRSEAARLIKERGGAVIGSVTKKTDYVLVGRSPGSKKDKAESLGLFLLTEEKFSKLL